MYMSSKELNSQVDVESDVLVVGYGGAGSAAAMAAHDSGVKVVILEKMAQGGGATYLSSGGILVPTDMEFVNYMYDICMGTTPRDVLEVFVERGMKIEDYFREIGGETERWKSQEIGTSYPPLGRPSWPRVPHGKSMVRCHAKAEDEKPLDWDKLSYPEKVRAIGRTYGADLWKMLKSKVEQRGIDIHFNTRANELIQNEEGVIVGVRAENNGRQMIYKAKRAVVMTTGGFGASEQLKKIFLHSPFIYAGMSYATGDGLIMAQKVGAAFWHTYGVCGQVGFKAPELEQPFQPRATDERYIWVDKHGRRYTNETLEKLHNAWRNVSPFDPEAMEFPRVPAYMIFDDVMMKKAPISRDWRPRKDHEWSLDNSEELARGWIKKGNTIGELARQLSMEESVLEGTIERFNEYCRKGEDPEFGRAPETMKPLEKPAYYALELLPMLISTGGGPAHDKESRAVDYSGNPIPRLYVAGELSSIIGGLYEAGTGHTECVVFGKIAGTNAAKETPLAE